MQSLTREVASVLSNKPFVMCFGTTILLGDTGRPQRRQTTVLARLVRVLPLFTAE